MGKAEPFHIQGDNPVALTGKERGIMPPREGRTSEPVDEHYGRSCWFCILFLDIDAHPVDIKKPAMLTDQIVRGHFGLRLAQGYQVGKNANKEKESQYQVRQYPQSAVSAPEAFHDCIILRMKAHTVRLLQLLLIAYWATVWFKNAFPSGDVRVVGQQGKWIVSVQQHSVRFPSGLFWGAGRGANSRYPKENR